MDEQNVATPRSGRGPEATAQPRIGVVILNYKGWQDTIACAESVLTGVVPPAWLVVVDNASPDDSVRWLRHWAAGRMDFALPELGAPRPCPKPLPLRELDEDAARHAAPAPLTLLRRRSNAGYAAGNNAGMRLLMDWGADAVWILNNDTIVDANCLEAMSRRLFAKQRPGLCGSLVCICYCQARFFGLKRGVWKLPPYSFSELLLHNMIFISSLFRKADWSRAGGFDESAEFGREDHIFWLTLAASGASVHQIPEILFHYRIKPHSRAARIARRLGERGVALKTFEGRENIYREHLRDLYEHCIDLDIEKRARERLCLWKFCRSLLAAERWTRDMGKRLFGR